MSRLPIRLRVTVAFALAMAAVLAGTALFVYLRLGSHLSTALDREVSATDMEAIKEVAEDPIVLKAALAELEKVGKANGFNGFERVKALRLLIEPFSVQNELLTPT